MSDQQQERETCDRCGGIGLLQQWPFIIVDCPECKGKYRKIIPADETKEQKDAD